MKKLIVLLVAFFLIGLAESEGKSYWQVRFANARYSSPGYHTGAQAYWGRRSKSIRWNKPQYKRTIISRPQYRGYYGGPWRRYREYGPHCK